MATTKPLSTEAQAAHRNARFLRHRRAGLSQGGRKPLTWEDAERALFERARVLELLAEKATTGASEFVDRARQGGAL